MFIFLSLCSLLVPLSMIILGYMWKGKPPKCELPEKVPPKQN